MRLQAYVSVAAALLATPLSVEAAVTHRAQGEANTPHGANGPHGGNSPHAGNTFQFREVAVPRARVKKPGSSADIIAGVNPTINIYAALLKVYAKYKVNLPNSTRSDLKDAAADPANLPVHVPGLAGAVQSGASHGVGAQANAQATGAAYSQTSGYANADAHVSAQASVQASASVDVHQGTHAAAAVTTPGAAPSSASSYTASPAVSPQPSTVASPQPSSSSAASSRSPTLDKRDGPDTLPCCAKCPPRAPSTKCTCDCKKPTAPQKCGGPGLCGSVKADPGYPFIDVDYVVAVEIGTPPQLLYLDLDTGSADLWVMSTETPTWELDGQRVYDPKASNTSSELLGYTWSIEYADDSSASGDVYTDVVDVGGISFPTQAVESATQISSEFTYDTEFSGIMGLAMSQLNTVQPKPQLTFMDNILNNLSCPVFTADLRHEAPGTYNFGFIDASAHLGPIAYAPVDPLSGGFWEFTMSGYQVQTSFVKRGYFSEQPITAIADTGTTLTFLPGDVVHNYYRHVHDAFFIGLFDIWIFPCHAELPDFVFGIGDYRGTIPGRYFNYGYAFDGYCFGGLQPSDWLGGFNIVGDAFLKAQFVVFDHGTPARVGFAPKVLIT